MARSGLGNVTHIPFFQPGNQISGEDHRLDKSLYIGELLKGAHHFPGYSGAWWVSCFLWVVVNRSDQRIYDEELLEATTSEVRSVGCLVMLVLAIPMFLAALTLLVFL
jgi:hypothetical protein